MTIMTMSQLAECRCIPRCRHSWNQRIRFWQKPGKTAYWAYWAYWALLHNSLQLKLAGMAGKGLRYLSSKTLEIDLVFKDIQSGATLLRKNYGFWRVPYHPPMHRKPEVQFAHWDLWVVWRRVATPHPISPEGIGSVPKCPPE